MTDGRHGDETDDGEAAQSADDSEQDIHGTLGSVTECATCPREAAGERVQALDHPDGDKKAWRLHLCRYCNRAFSLGNGDRPLVTDGGHEQLGDGYDYECSGDRRKDDRHAAKARDLARAGIISKAQREAGKIRCYERHQNVLDEVMRLAK